MAESAFSISTTATDQKKGKIWQRLSIIVAVIGTIAIVVHHVPSSSRSKSKFDQPTSPIKTVPMVVVAMAQADHKEKGKMLLNNSEVREEVIHNSSFSEASKSVKKDNKLSKIFESKDKVALGSAKTLLQDMLSLIRHRYELDGAGAMFMHTANNIGAHTWDVIKYKFARKIVDSQIKQKQQPQRFLMVFGGSSVTAGHDNYYNQSYPFVVERRLQPVLQALGIALKVTNIAQGANPCLPYSLCYETMGGLDADVIGWEQSYNCGGDEMVSEYMGRVAAFSANRAIVYYSASGAWNPEKCPSSNSTPPYAYEYWRPQMAGLTPWTPSHADILNEKNTLDEWNKAHESSDRFTKWKNKGDAANKNLAAHGFNVWEANPKCVIPDPKGNLFFSHLLFS